MTPLISIQLARKKKENKAKLAKHLLTPIGTSPTASLSTPLLPVAFQFAGA